MSEDRIPILDDLPTETDGLDFSPYVNTLIGVCKTANTPLTVGIFGSWGSGKTSLMKMIRKGLPKNYTIAWFDAWKYTNEETLWRAFLLCVLIAIEEKKGASKEENQETLRKLDNLKSTLYRSLELEKIGGVTIDLPKLGAEMAQGAVQIGLSFIPPLAQLTKLVEELQKDAAGNLTGDAVDAIRRERTKIYIDQVRSLEQFQQTFSEVVKAYVTPGRLVVFVDDLDRCLPEKAIEVLEAIKLFVDVPHCVFVLGLDREVIARGVEIRYKEFARPGQRANPIDGVRYLEKIIQLPFAIPPVERGDMGSFVRGLANEWPRPECPDVFAEGLGDNPRQIKRTVNVFLMLWRLAYERREKLKERVKPIRLAKVVTIQAVAPDLYALLTKQPGLLRDIEQYYRQEQSQKGERLPEVGGVKAETGKQTQTQLPEDLLRLLSETPAVGQVLTMHPLELPEANFHDQKPDELRSYFTLTRQIEAPLPVVAEVPRLVFEPQMVPVPAGEFWMGTTPEQAAQAVKEGLYKDTVKNEQPQHKVLLPAYAIGKYPITCREYQSFLQDSQQRPPQGWSGNDYPEGKGDHPVVNVSWQDAQAYCAWLSQKTGKSYRLPGEAEWEKAARGMDGRIYPWGDQFDAGRANTLEARLKDTTPVGQFSPQGDSPYGCADMAGNVLEWISSLLKPYPYNPQDGREDPQAPGSRAVRGGAFNHSRGYAHCAYRSDTSPGVRGDVIGFRVAVVSPVFTSEL